jgi:hypothetical protein
MVLPSLPSPSSSGALCAFDKKNKRNTSSSFICCCLVYLEKASHSPSAARASSLRATRRLVRVVCGGFSDLSGLAAVRSQWLMSITGTLSKFCLYSAYQNSFLCFRFDLMAAPHFCVCVASGQLRCLVLMPLSLVRVIRIAPRDAYTNTQRERESMSASQPTTNPPSLSTYFSTFLLFLLPTFLLRYY